jgi:hypothetical protein
VELRLGLVDTRMKEYAQRIQPTHDVGQQVLDTLLARNPNLVQDHRTISPTLLASHLLGFGPNLYWRVDAEQRQGHVLIHPDAVREAAVKDLTQLRKVFGIDLSDAAYAKAAVTELDAHETGHMIMGWMDSKVAGRIGLHEQREAWILEELKAETVASNLIEQRLKRGDDLDPLAQFAAKLSSVLYYATGKSPEGSGERYYYTGLAELAALLEGGVLVPSGKGYRVTDPRRGIQILAGKGEEILQRFHANPSCTPGDVRAFVAPLKGRVTADARVQAFLKTARGA